MGLHDITTGDIAGAVIGVAIIGGALFVLNKIYPKPAPPAVIDADYRIPGEGRWEPFRRWVLSHFPADWPYISAAEKRSRLLWGCWDLAVAGVTLAVMLGIALLGRFAFNKLILGY